MQGNISLSARFCWLDISSSHTNLGNCNICFKLRELSRHLFLGTSALETEFKLKKLELEMRRKWEVAAPKTAKVIYFFVSLSTHAFLTARSLVAC